MQVTHIRPYAVTGEVLYIKGQQTVSFMVDGRRFNRTYMVCSLPSDAAGLLGTDSFLNKAGVSIDFGCGKMSLAGIGKVPRECKVSPTRGAALTIFTAGKEGHSPLNPVYGRLGIKTSSSQPAPHREQTAVQNGTWLVRAKENTTIAPRCRQTVTGIEESGKKTNTPTLDLHRARSDSNRRNSSCARFIAS